MFTFLRSAVKYVGLLSFLLSFSCTREDLSECDYYLQLRYDYNLASEDWFAEQVEEVKVYLFDKEGAYVQCFTDSIPATAVDGYKIKLPYTMKSYTAVVWAGHTGSYQLPTMNVGDSKEKLTLLYNPLEGKSDQAIDNLWHNGPTELLFPEAGGSTQTLSLVRNTNDFFIQLHNSDGESVLTDYHIKITSANGSYQYTNLFLSENQPIDYFPHTIVDDKAQLRTLRLLENDDIRISITDNQDRPILMGGQTEFKLIEYLLQTKPAGMAAQEYLDRCYIWDISLSLNNYVALTISINGWVTWFDNTEI